MDIVGFSGKTVDIGDTIGYTNKGQRIAEAGSNPSTMTIPELAKLHGVSIIPASQPGSKENPADSPEGYTGNFWDWWKQNVALPTGDTATKMVTDPVGSVATALDPKYSKYGIYAVLLLVIVVAILGLILPEQQGV